MGRERTSSIQLCVTMSNQPARCPNMASTATINVRGSVHQKRREKSFSSGLSSSSRLGMSGSSPMPQIGQLPG
ncbi:hypothetical protein KYG_13256 [Acidovorax sp. NO-1]|nr:hypothetical protein KYG_13256 [Acidovorax sp. NO-1]